MKIGLIPLNVGVSSVEQMIGLARKAESVGVESVWTFEHVIVPVDYQSKYPYSPNGKMGATPETPFIDPLIALTAIAGATERVRLGTGVNIVAQTNPLLLAKQVASLDFVSGGRFMLGAGIGWLQEEFDAMGTPFERRGARFDDAVEAMRKVWSGEVVEHDSEFLHWHGFKSHPTPVQAPFPIVIGGAKGKAFERIARHGQGWFAPSGSARELAGLLEKLKDACKHVGRDFSEIEISAMWTNAADGIDALAPYIDLGVHRMIAPIFALGAASVTDGLDKLGTEVISKL